MSKKEGLIVHFDESRRNELIACSDDDGGYVPFTDALSIHDWTIKDKQIALLSFADESINYMCLVTKGKRVVTSKSRIEFTELISLGDINIKSIENLISENVKRYFIKSSQGHGGRVPIATWLQTIDAIKTLKPEMVGEIERLLSIKEMSRFSLRGSSSEILLQEREALGIALDIFEGGSNLRKKVLGGWSPNLEDVSNMSNITMEATLNEPPKGRACFLNGIPSRYIQEETAIQHDLFNWDAMSQAHEMGVSQFTSGERVLDVFYANRNALEKTTGVDLIYFNRRFNLFVLVQYKLMKKENDEVLYRPDAQLEEELKRMDFLSSMYGKTDDIQSHDEYRLCNDGFLMKFVPNSGIKPASSELIKGMYITRKYMNFLLSENGPKGVRGGSIISFSNSPRYLTNSDFTKFINKGWLGTNGATSEVVKSIIKSYYETGNAVLVASEKQRENNF